MCLRWSRIVRNVPRYWSFLVLRDKFSAQKVKEALRMAKGYFETIKLYNLFANDLIRLGRIFRQTSPAVQTLYYETTESSSIIALASLGLKPESLIVQNEDLRGPPVTADLRPIFSPTLRTLSLHRSTSLLHNFEDYVPLLDHLTSLTITGFRFIGVGLFRHITRVEEIILDFKEQLVHQSEPHITDIHIPLPSLRVFKLRHVPFPTEMSLPALSIHAPMLHTLHLDSTDAALWLLAFSGSGAPAAIVDFRVDRPNGPAIGLSHLQPFFCDTIESFALTSVSHELGPLLSDIHAGLILPRLKHLEFTFHDD